MGDRDAMLISIMSTQNIASGIAAIAVMLFLVVYFIMPVITDMNSDPFSQNFEVVTGVGETSADVTLSQEHYFSTTEEMSVSSDDTNDSPAILLYVDATEVVTVGGLVASGTRILTVNYVTESYQSDMFTGWGPFMVAIPAILVLLVIYAIWRQVSSGK